MPSKETGREQRPPIAIISWEKPLIEIDPVCRKTRDRIAQPLMPLLMEGLRIKDENRVERRNLPPADVARPPATADQAFRSAPGRPPRFPGPGPPRSRLRSNRQNRRKRFSRGVQILAALAIVGLLGWKFVFLPRQGQLEYRRVSGRCGNSADPRRKSDSAAVLHQHPSAGGPIPRKPGICSRAPAR